MSGRLEAAREWLDRSATERMAEYYHHESMARNAGSVVGARKHRTAAAISRGIADGLREALMVLDEHEEADR